MSKEALSDNPHVRRLRLVLADNGRDTAALESILSFVRDMELVVKQTEGMISDMKQQLDGMREIQDHPLKTKLQKTVKALETKVAELKKLIADIKANVIEGCKNALAEFREKGAAALDKLASFFRIKGAMQTVYSNAVKGIEDCDKALSSISQFAKEYHSAGRAIRNMARVAIGRQPVRRTKKAGRIAAALSAPYLAEKKRLTKLRDKATATIKKLDGLESRAETYRTERKEKIAQRIADRKQEIQRKDREKPIPARAAKAAEV